MLTTSTMRGVRMHCEQSSVETFPKAVPCAAMDGSFSTRTTFCPPFAISSAAEFRQCRRDNERGFVTGTLIGFSGLLRLTFSTIIDTRSTAYRWWHLLWHEPRNNARAGSPFAEERISPISAHAFGKSVHACGRTCGDYNSVEFLIFDGFPDKTLSGSEHIYL